MPELPPTRHPHAAPPAEEPSRIDMQPVTPPPADLFAGWDRALDTLSHAHEAILHIDHDLHCLLPKPDMGQVISLSQYNAVKIETFGRRYYRLLLSASASVVFDMPAGMITLSLSAGWNVINLPDGTSMTLSTGNPINAYALASDHING